MGKRNDAKCHGFSLNPWQFPSFRLCICKFSCKNEFYCNLLFSFSWVQVVCYVYLLFFVANFHFLVLCMKRISIFVFLHFSFFVLCFPLFPFSIFFILFSFIVSRFFVFLFPLFPINFFLFSFSSYFLFSIFFIRYSFFLFRYFIVLFLIFLFCYFICPCC